MAIKSKKKGKSGGSRIISHVRVSNEQVYLLTIYDKVDKASVSDAEIIDLLNSIDE
jgi:mRNA-degrading endonuclease RelE of RelBE toxin-antitoxin system